MAAVTGTMVALGGLGLSAAQAIKANKDMKTYSESAKQVQNLLKNIKEDVFLKQKKLALASMIILEKLSIII